MNSVTIIGAGKLGQSLARLWHDKNILLIQQICNRSTESAKQAIAFIGAGLPANAISNIEPCDFVLIATPDTHIQTACETLAREHDWIGQCTVFHCSGVLTSDALVSAAKRGARVASAHPVRSFAEPTSVIKSFKETVCGVEGDDIALLKLRVIFEALGAKFLKLDAKNKTLYHCAAVFANNYLVTLIDIAQQLYTKAGLNREQSMTLLAPMLRESTENIIRHGPAKSLTGPIARGDIVTIQKHLDALAAGDDDTQLLYRLLGRYTSKLVDTSGTDPALAQINKLLQ